MISNKRYINLLGVALVATSAWGLTSCDKVDEDDRLIYVAPASVSGHVLIEDFTGQSCINCPAASAVIAELQETYGHENVIAVGLYSGPFGRNTKGTLFPLTTETGNYYYDGRGIEAQPCATINRGAASYNTAEWATAVRDALQKTSTVTLDAVSEAGPVANGYVIDVTYGSLETHPDSKLNVWVVEDNVISWQLLPGSQTDREYVHNHVFRTALSALDGDAISLVANEEGKATYKLDLSEVDSEGEWNAENLSVVVFATNIDGVLQVISEKINN